MKSFIHSNKNNDSVSNGVSKNKNQLKKSLPKSGIEKNKPDHGNTDTSNNNSLVNASAPARKRLVIDKEYKAVPHDSRGTNKLGLGEKLKLKSSATGAVDPKAGVGQPVYTLESGPGTLTGQNYKANSRTGSALFSVKRSDEDDSLKDKLQVTVIAPDDAQFESYSKANIYGNNMAGAAFEGNNTIYKPRDVSFNGLKFREGECEMQVRGAFEYRKAKHNAGSEFGVDQKNVESSTDEIKSGGITKTEFETKGEGYSLWPIPWQYRLPGKSWTTFITANHRADINTEATVKMKKLNGHDLRAVPTGPWKKP